MKPEAASMTAEPPLWKTVKIDCFSAKMDVHKTQSELIDKPTLNKTSAGRKTKKRKLGVTRSSTTLKNAYSKLGRKVHLNGGGLAYILFKPKHGECECAQSPDRGDAQQQVPFTYYPSKKQHDLEREFLEEINRRLSESQTQPSHSSRHKQFIDNLNKLYSDIGGGLGTGEKRSVSQCTPEELDEIRHEFEVFFNQTSRSSKQTQTKLKMKSLKSNKSKSRTKWTMSADLTRHLRKSSTDGTSKSTKKRKLKVSATGRGAPSSEEQQPNGKERKTSKLYQLGSENGKRMSSTRLWRTSMQKERAPSTTPKSVYVSFKADGLDDSRRGRKPSVEKPSTSAHLEAKNQRQSTKTPWKPPTPFMRSTYANFNYVSAWGRKRADS
ncbi:unnamed protein product [Ceratitis capitata]|uniref:(Mediterranean fruit fly) hypothetical protein n=1 Tax=Ceratitis capitata TaxID=7213 RepID=A0A811UFD3_CERCA|nr:unnamed protein product [Ceratitis capitata]